MASSGHVPLTDEVSPAKAKRRAFKQQTFYSWLPLWQPRSALTLLLLIGVVCIPLGLGLLWASKEITETYFDYTRCRVEAARDGTFSAPSSTTSAAAGLLFSNPLASVVGWSFNPTSQVCTLRFRVSVPIDAPLLLFIRLSNFLQNHRTYVKSLSTSQLAGSYIANAGDLGVTSGGDPICGWLQYANCSTAAGLTFVSDTSKAKMSSFNVDCRGDPFKDAVLKNAAPNAQYYPCGLIANSYFSDDISDPQCISTDSVESPCTPNSTIILSTKNIAFPEDFNRVGTPTTWINEHTNEIPTHLIPPPQWRAIFPQWKNGYNATNLPDFKNWERFLVWTRVSGMSTFRKTWARNDTVGMLRGIYEIKITDTFDVIRFGGTKSLVFSTVTPVGSANYNFTAIAFFVAAGIAILSSIVLGAASYFSGRSLGDERYLSWKARSGIQPVAKSDGVGKEEYEMH
ncbi:CDC50/LEM3 family [Cladochytrium replicatum]|nr:CDC50/LEM3 family [Cladochytrium replicatum]